MQTALLTLLLAWAQAGTVVAPRALISRHPDPGDLANQAMAQCQRLPTPLACLAYQSALYQLGDARQRQQLGQIMAPQSSFVGRYRDALRFDPFAGAHTRGLDQAAAPPPSDRARDAVDAVARLARSRQLVMVNEYHMDASTRALTIALLPRLYAEGYRYLAVEALSSHDAALASRGYAIAATGYYTREPVFAELLARAVHLGYTLVPYESDGATQQAREDGQARHIVERIFKLHPHARVLVHAGIAHIGEKPGIAPGHARPMAMRLHALTGIDPLTVDQAVLRPNSGSRLRRDLLARFKPAHPVVIEDAQGAPWSAFPGIYDVTVLMPDVGPGRARPAWLSLYGTRHPATVRAAWCKRRFPCQVLALPSDRKDDAVPSDGYAFLGQAKRATLYLDPGRYRVLARDATGRILSSRQLTVPGETPP